MKRLMLAVTVLVLSTAATASGQQPAAPADAHHPREQAPPVTAAMPMMEMCRSMMAGHGTPGGGQPMMGGGHDMMGGMGMMGGDPKMMASMMEMRGEMMKAMGDVMLKHAKKMQQLPPAAK